MRTLLWAVAVLALEVLLLSGYFAVVGVGQMVSRNVALALLVGTVSVVVWLGFKNGFEQIWRRLLLTIIGCIVVTYAALVVAAVVDLPTAIVCERKDARGSHPTHPGWTLRRTSCGALCLLQP